MNTHNPQTQPITLTDQLGKGGEPPSTTSPSMHADLVAKIYHAQLPLVRPNCEPC
ncbi:hypothetical protein QUF64_07765 [Anaerolineales bacterium HSG6]|nr:hypothetical protein [Anaerolineales bacterium HSG6]